MEDKKNKLPGMTVNERLFEIKKIDEFDKLVKNKDIVGICYLMNSIYLKESDTA